MGTILSYVAYLFISMSFAQIVQPGTVTRVNLDDETAKRFSVLRVEGNIAAPMASELRDHLAQFPDGVRVILDYNSPGGIDLEGNDMIAILQKEKTRLKIESLVKNGGMCASMCIPLYMQASRRVAGERALFMFHGVKPWYTNIPQSIPTLKYTDLLTEAGLSDDWLQGVRDKGVFTEPTDYWQSGEDLYIDKSNVVTELLPKLVKNKPWRAPIDPYLAGPH